MRQVTVTLVGTPEECDNLIDLVLQKFGENELQIDIDERESFISDAELFTGGAVGEKK